MKADYGWIVLIGAIVLIAILWKPLTPYFTQMSDTVGNKDQIEAGRAVFYDGDRWIEGSGYSCATCHAADWVPPKDKLIDMKDYKEGEPYILKGMKKKYGGGIMGTDDALYRRMMKCVTGYDRIRSYEVSVRLDYIEDLMVYVSAQ